jgi:multiple sugar transport system substrate-binding protein
MLINNKQFKPFYAVFILAGFFLFCMGNPDRLSALTNDNGKSDSKDDTKIEITIAYPYDFIFKTALEDEIAAEFMAAHPNISIIFEPPYKKYEEGTSRILEQAETNKLPDISFQGINRQRILVSHNLAVSLDVFISKDSEWQRHGINPGMMEICKFDKKIYGLPFAISTPVFYYNADLVGKAGGDPDNLPTDWEGILKLGSKIDALGPDIHGLIYDYEITGNWLFQSLIFSKGGEMTSPDEKKVRFAGERGRWAMQLFDRMVKEGGMPSIPTFRDNKGRIGPIFFTGRVGILASSTGGIGYFQKKIGKKFELRTAVFPDVVSEIGKLPVGGNVAMILSKDPLKQKAAWEFIRFATSPHGQTLQVKHTGYMPSNFLAVKNPDLLGRYYGENPLKQTSIDQLLLAKRWYAFPGPDALKITKVIEKHIRSVVTQEVDPDTAQKKMVEEVEALLPK